MTRTSESGVSLVEVLVAVAIMGIAFVTIIGGMGTSAAGSDIHRKQASSGVVLEAYAEAVKAASYATCATTSAYSPASVGYSVPAGHTAQATAVAYWHANADPSTGSFSGSCGSDEGWQRISLRVASADGRATEVIDIGKRRP